jgi:hypothetical protein
MTQGAPADVVSSLQHNLQHWSLRDKAQVNSTSNRPHHVLSTYLHQLTCTVVTHAPTAACMVSLTNPSSNSAFNHQHPTIFHCHLQAHLLHNPGTDAAAAIQEVLQHPHHSNLIRSAAYAARHDLPSDTPCGSASSSSQDICSRSSKQVGSCVKPTPSWPPHILQFHLAS